VLSIYNKTDAVMKNDCRLTAAENTTFYFFEEGRKFGRADCPTPFRPGNNKEKE
jgi:hypothetical protein